MIGNIFNLSNEIDIEFFTDPDTKEVEYLIINTCGFLSSSRKEAENLIKEYDDLGKKIIVMGCYSEVKDDEFLSNLKHLYAVIPHNESKNLDLIFKNKSLQTLKSKLAGVKQEKLKKYLKNIGGDNISSKAFIWQSQDVRAYLNADYGYEYLKISEGCDNNCSFCIIPNIRGRQKSRSLEDILAEVQIMIKSGRKEIQIISQDLTRYGTDIYKEPRLLDLLEKIDKLDGDFKYRLYYLYPDILTFNHLERLKNLKKMLPYFDLPFQHISPKILKLMGRFYNEEHIYKFLGFIKENFKNAFIHTNFIVGFPGEEEGDFEKLKDFAKKYEFDSVSMFGYHDEVLATSNKLPNKINDKIIQERVLELREILEEIYDKKYEERIGKTHIGYIHEISGNKLGVRPEIKAPEIDELDYIKKENVLSEEIGIGKKIEYRL
ncbi:MAG: MiaB/RimO family radical SAM methylthiotransferase [Candidatus Gracilibacteria bacterium]|nr:MiaB/RimO family radical SAM methylthiotransferase [Candidatus Gracilibacteria bacterium]